MLVILRKIPSATFKTEIIDFIEPALNHGVWGVLGKKGYISSVEIIRRRNKSIGNGIGRIEFDALLRIEPDNAGHRVIRRLNRNRFKGKRIEVREYHLRTWHNDRRDEGFKSRIDFKEHRKTDRRCNNFEIIKAQKPQDTSECLDKYIIT